MRKGTYGSRDGTVVGISLSRIFEILRADGDLCVRHGKAQSVGYIGTSIAIDYDLIALLYRDHEEVCWGILDVSTKLHRKIDHIHETGILELNDDCGAIAEVNSVVDGNG